MTGQLRILVLIGSPRSEESWTYRVIRQIERKMNDLQPTAFEYVFLGKLQVPYCDGCLSCVRVGEESCPEFATIGPIAARMDAADGLVLGAPVHTFAVTGLMKSEGYGEGYRYAHDEEGGVAAGEVYLPDELSDARFYEPTDRGYERAIAERLRRLRGEDESGGSSA
ncbi:MAG: NAD(P)H-dependent oxidoreductase [Polyangiaceae bacterium]|nr:NAD(P)H-dependent oxidoreductase [Polyangiaceae bacterium]